MWEPREPPSLVTESWAQLFSENSLTRCFHFQKQVILKRTRVLGRRYHSLCLVEAPCCWPVGPQLFGVRPSR